MTDLSPIELSVLAAMEKDYGNPARAEFLTFNGINQGELEAIRSSLIKRSLLTVTGRITPDGTVALQTTKGN